MSKVVIERSLQRMIDEGLVADGNIPKTLYTLKRILMHEAMVETNGCATKASALIGVSRAQSRVWLDCTVREWRELNLNEGD